jgi:hypothetical protein
LSMCCSIQIVSHVITTHSAISEIISFSAPWKEYNSGLLQQEQMNAGRESGDK